ncbi:MAG TPA: aminotransferase class I/II-fold pyridoxal phosphate-dependent enzyme [Candidatus Eisenbacteria bacterium]|nr:aminotransferase class I/II-fold pyridoxal phosphate-dependent enzyme [Candidatus Eisenbacteria bacterium]
MPQPSRRSQQIPFSPIRAMFRLADEMERAGKGPVIRFHVGDPDFAPPAAVVEATHAAMKAGKTHYPPSVGVHELRLALAEKVEKQNGIRANVEQVVTSPGSTEALVAVMEIALHPGDEILIPEIYWPNYVQQALLASAKPVFYPLGAGYQPDVEGTRRAITPRTRCILVNSPSNPTGAVAPEATLRALHALAREHDLWIISDEAYEDIVFDATHFSMGAIERDLPESERRVLSLFTFSKSYAMTGFRLGYIVAPTMLMGTILRKTQEPLVGSTASMIQWGGLAALRDPAPIAAMRDAYRRRRDIAVSILREAGMVDYTPQGAFYIMADVSSTGMTGDAFAKALLEEEKVCVAPAAGFALAPEFGSDGVPVGAMTAGGAPDYPSNPKARHLVRIAFCVSDDDVREGLTRLVRFAERRRQQAGAAVRA